MYTNRSLYSDFALNAIERYGRQSDTVKIAVPFFTDLGTVEWLVKQGCQIRLVVRLGFPTSAEALSKLLRNKNVQIRYFTDPAFHSKLYIFGDHTALVGSANLTKRALTSNQEILLTVHSDDPRFEELALLFSEYWEDAGVLTDEEVKRYRYVCGKHDQASSGMLQLDQDIIDSLGKVTSRNIKRDKVKRSAEVVFLDDYRKTYQETVAAFTEIREIYEELGKRKVPEEYIPLRLEVDSFISYVREAHAQGDAWQHTAIPSRPSDRLQVISDLIEKWHATHWKWFESHIVKEGYPLLRKVFESPVSLKSSADDELFESLCVVHSFLERRRFYQSGLQGLKNVFFKANDRERMNYSLSYLIFGGDETVKRMCNLIFDPRYKLAHFGRSNVQELVGWISREDLPVINGRTTKVLHYLGFDVRQCQ